MLIRPPLFCMFSSGASEVSDEVADFRSHERLLAVRQLVIAVQLLREGEVYDPADFIQYQRIESLNVRSPRRFGRLAYGIRNDFKLEARDIPVLDGNLEAVDVLFRRRVDASVDSALSLFRASYDPALTEPRDRFLFLLGAMEALLGDRVRAVDRISWPTSALQSFAAVYRRERNAVAHGASAASMDGVRHLRELVRIVLREAIAQSVHRGRGGWHRWPQPAGAAAAAARHGG